LTRTEIEAGHARWEVQRNGFEVQRKGEQEADELRQELESENAANSKDEMPHLA
jgi:hypothetical protein